MVMKFPRVGERTAGSTDNRTHAGHRDHHRDARADDRSNLSPNDASAADRAQGQPANRQRSPNLRRALPNWLGPHRGVAGTRNNQSGTAPDTAGTSSAPARAEHGANTAAHPRSAIGSRLRGAMRHWMFGVATAETPHRAQESTNTLPHAPGHIPASTPSIETPDTQTNRATGDEQTNNEESTPRTNINFEFNEDNLKATFFSTEGEALTGC